MKYEFTLTLKPQWYQFTANRQFDICYPVLWNILEKYEEVSCVAELTGEHNVHFHGMIELKDIRAKENFLNRFRPHHKLFGRKSCDAVSFEDSYKNYMRKSLDETGKVIPFPLIRDYYGVCKDIFE